MPKRKSRQKSKSKSKKMKGGAPMSELGNVFSNLGFLSQSAFNQFSVPIPTLVGQLPDTPLVTQQFPLIQRLALD
jgi:hypothetical protein